jgi:SAM-dependent methyltransferase
LLTDGNNAAVAIAKRNISKMGLQDKVAARVLSWEDDFQELSGSFDVIIGCELMYYKLDLPVLLSAVRRLLQEDGLFLHAHIFRAPNLECDLITQMAAFGWSTLEIPLTEVVCAEELHEHADWFNVRCLVSGSWAAVEALRRVHSTWLPFAEDIADGRFGPDDEEEAVGFGHSMN